MNVSQISNMSSDCVWPTVQLIEGVEVPPAPLQLLVRSPFSCTWNPCLPGVSPDTDTSNTAWVSPEFCLISTHPVTSPLPAPLNTHWARRSFVGEYTGLAVVYTGLAVVVVLVVVLLVVVLVGFPVVVYL